MIRNYRTLLRGYGRNPGVSFTAGNLCLRVQCHYAFGHTYRVLCGCDEDSNVENERCVCIASTYIFFSFP